MITLAMMTWGNKVDGYLRVQQNKKRPRRTDAIEDKTKAILRKE